MSTNQLIFKSDAPIHINSDSELSLIASAGNGSQLNPYLIENYVINGTGLNSHGILIGNTTAHFIIQNCIIQEVDNSYSGIVLENLTNGRIQDSTINNSNFGIYLHKTNDTTINDNKVNDNEYGIYLEDSNGLEILRNNLSNHYYHGIYILHTNNSHIHGNIAYNSYHSGIRLSGWHNNITENTAYHSKMGWLNPNGLYAAGAHYNNIDGNNFSHNIDYGITVSSSTYNNFSNNLIKDNGAPSEYIEDSLITIIDKSIIDDFIVYSTTDFKSSHFVINYYIIKKGIIRSAHVYTSTIFYVF
jgi:parallel beta-helix repeat protein